MNMSPESLKAKYGDTAVMGVDAVLFHGVLQDGFTKAGAALVHQNGAASPLKDVIYRSLKPRLRCEAELDPGFKQIIPYMILDHATTGRIFAMARIGGDERLLGRISLGLGGHIDEGEEIEAALYRELAEEAGLSASDITDIVLCGYIFGGKSQVDSVHVGMVYRLLTDLDEVHCLERDKLLERWYTRRELRELRLYGRMESWSELVYDNLLGGIDAEA